MSSSQFSPTSAVLAVAVTLGVTQTLVTSKLPLDSLWGSLVLPPALGAAMGCGLGAAFLTYGQGEVTLLGVAAAALLTSAGLAASFAASLAQRTGEMRRDFQRVRTIPQVCLILTMGILWRLGQMTRTCGCSRAESPSSSRCSCSSLRLAADQLTRAHRRRWMPPRSFGRHAASAYGVAIASQFLYRADVVAVSFFLSPRLVGLYSVAIAAGSSVASLGQAAGMLTFSDLRRAEGSASRKLVIGRGVRTSILVSSGWRFRWPSSCRGS